MKNTCQKLLVILCVMTLVLTGYIVLSIAEEVPGESFAVEEQPVSEMAAEETQPVPVPAKEPASSSETLTASAEMPAQTEIHAAEAPIQANAEETLLADEPETCSSFEEKEFYSMAKDQLMQALMGLYYSEKISAAVDLKLYNATSDTAYQNSSIEHLNKAVEYWKAYAAEFEARYRPLMMSRLQVAPDPVAFMKDVEKGISIGQKRQIH